LCDDYGLPRPETNTCIEGMECDFVWRHARLVVEVDGFRHHRSRRRFTADRERDVALRIAGWTVLRFAWEHVTDRGAWVAGAVRKCLAG
jgi:very-short-patch-repair endonuclease